MTFLFLYLCCTRGSQTRDRIPQVLKNQIIGLQAQLEGYSNAIGADKTEVEVVRFGNRSEPDPK
jgi:hypothetical protein